ncbi:MULTISPECIES: DctP family TRAP transporter solute-binding subunit [Bacillus]|uniref:DctP family TRAP transporter solute-binding subunit n=1 Tax=Bacillus TaxID=1386 RepID=UPI00273FC2EF|nr:DctP family TRAP transporter solute-binding subunit [Bacillus sp. MMSF_3328]
MRRGKIYIGFVVSAIIMLLIAGCSSGSSTEAGGKKVKLKMSVTVGNTSTWFKAAEQFADEVEKESEGRITIEVFPNEQLSGGDSGKAVELLSKGSIDFTYNSTIIYSILNDKLGVLSAPFLFKDLSEVDEKLNGEAGEEVKKILRDIGVEPLGFGQNGFRQVTNSKKEIKTPDDIKGMKIRIPGIKMYTDLWSEFGADPTTMTFSEVFTSLQQGTIDGQENPIDVISSSKLNEVQDYITMWNYSYDPLILGMNKKKFDSLSDEDKKIIQTAADNANKFQIEEARKVEEEQIQGLKDAGMTFYYPTEEDLEKFKEVSQPIYDQYKDVWGADLLEAFQK